APPDGRAVLEIKERGVRIAGAARDAKVLDVCLQGQVPRGYWQLAGLERDRLVPGGERFIVVLDVHQERVAVLLEVRGADRHSRLLPRLGEYWEQNGSQDGDYGNDDKEFDERESDMLSLAGRQRWRQSHGVVTPFYLAISPDGEGTKFPGRDRGM